MADGKEEVVAPVPGTPEYEVAMAAKVDDSAAKAAVAAGVTPEGVPAEGAEGNTEEADKKEPQEGIDKKPEEGSEEDAKKAVEAAGIDYSKLQAEYAEGGALSEESYKALEDAGFPREVVSEYVAGQEALAELRVLQAADAVGGKDALSKMQEWAAKTLAPAEIDAYNKGVSGSKEDMLQAVNSLKSRYESTYGRQPNLLGGNPANTAAVGYASKAEMTADMRDPRYAKDPAFRAKVEAKVANSTAF